MFAFSQTLVGELVTIAAGVSGESIMGELVGEWSAIGVLADGAENGCIVLTSIEVGGGVLEAIAGGTRGRDGDITGGMDGTMTDGESIG
jgi:hypothetical protein